jgi:hypothetical protein
VRRRRKEDCEGGRCREEERGLEEYCVPHCLAVWRGTGTAVVIKVAMRVLMELTMAILIKIIVFTMVAITMPTAIAASSPLEYCNPIVHLPQRLVHKCNSPLHSIPSPPVLTPSLQTGGANRPQRRQQLAGLRGHRGREATRGLDQEVLHRPHSLHRAAIRCVSCSR